MSKYHPGPGWKKVGPSVYEHDSGVRIHLMCALLLIPGREPVFGDVYPGCKEVNRYINMNGGNRKRGIMAWARSQN